MKRFSIKATGHNVSVIAQEEKTLADILTEKGFDLGYTFSISGVTIDRDALNAPISELERYGLVDDCVVFGCNKVANAATAKICGRAVVIESTMKLDEVKLMAKHRPGAMTLFEGDEKNSEELFKVFVGSGKGCIDKNGVVFGEANNDGFATVTVLVPDDVNDIKAWVNENIGMGLLYLNEIETYAGEVMSEILEEQTAINNAIQVL